MLRTYENNPEFDPDICEICDRKMLKYRYQHFLVRVCWRDSKFRIWPAIPDPFLFACELEPTILLALLKTKELIPVNDDDGV